jgi:hypothetical protein
MALFLSMYDIAGSMKILTSHAVPFSKIISTRRPLSHNSWYRLKLEYLQLRNKLKRQKLFIKSMSKFAAKQYFS